MYYRIEITPAKTAFDVRASSILKKISKYSGISVKKVMTRDVYSLFVNTNEEEISTIAEEITDSVGCKWKIGQTDVPGYDWIILIGYKPGVTDNIANTAREAICDIINRPLQDDEWIFSSIEYLIQAPHISQELVQSIATGLLANSLIQNITTLKIKDCDSGGIPVNKPIVENSTEIYVDQMDLDVNDEKLLKLSQKRQLALSLPELKAIKSYFGKHSILDSRAKKMLPNQPTDVEIEVIAQTWSEHCKHKIFSAKIEYINEEGTVEIIDGLYPTYIKKSTFEIGEEIDWLVSVFKDNAGIIRFNDNYDIAYKVETHNSPSALDPYGGAITGIVGVNRDPLGTGIGANLLINAWGYCFASPFTKPDDVPEGLLHPERIRDGVHQGVIDGGNQSGIPYGIGWEYFDPRYLGKPLVFCGTVGRLPRKICDAPSHEKSIHSGDLIVMAGGFIGKDGIHGATFSSEELKQSSSAQVVQIGDPITQKKLSDFIIEARNEGLYRFITDNGAGGLSSSVGEMAIHCGGCSLDLTNAPLKYEGLQPWEILLSESQERMTMAVPPELIGHFSDLAKRRDVQIAVIGKFNDTGIFQVVFEGKITASLDLDFLHDGCPKMELKARWESPTLPNPTPKTITNESITKVILSVTSRLNICSNESKARQYDHEVKGLSVVKPFVGIHNDVASDATVSMIEPLSKEGIILSCGVLPQYSDIDTYHMTASAIDLAIRRTIAVGGKLGHIAAIDNFCWPDPVQSSTNTDGEYKLAQLVRSNKALYEFTKAFQVPCISGKDSMKNDSTRGGIKISIPPTLLFSTIAKMDDVSKAMTLDVKFIGDIVYLLGKTEKELGGSEYYASLGCVGSDVPQVNVQRAIKRYTQMSKAIDQGLCHSVHALSIGGLAIGLVKMAIGGRLGMDLDLTTVPTERTNLKFDEILFSESNSRFVVSVPSSKAKTFEDLFQGQAIYNLGKVSNQNALCLRFENKNYCNIPLQELVNAYKNTLKND